MKKRTLMRMLSLLLVMTLISTCAISGTFAKYVTRATGEDQARVAKWGILVNVEGDTAFATQYEADDKDTEIEYTVVSSLDDNVVAPGTKNPVPALSGGVTGTPEVAVRYTLEIKDWTDIVLPAGTYTDYTNYVLGEGYSGTFTLDEAYAPIKWDITVTNGTKTIGLLTEAANKLNLPVATLNENGLYGFSVTEAKEIINTYASSLEDLLMSIAPTGAKNAKVEIVKDENNKDVIRLSMDFEPGTEMNYTFALTWMWNFEGQLMTMYGPNNYTVFDAETVDMADTYLGNIAAGIDGIVVPEGTSTIVKATVTATATQID